MLLMNQSEYAKHRGVSKQAISKSKDKLVFDAASGKIDVAASDRALGDVRQRVNIGDDDIAGDGSADPGAGGSGGYVPPAETGRLTQARTATEIYRARLAQLEYDERVGKLLQLEDVTRSMRLCAEAIARDIELLPLSAEELAVAFQKDNLPGLRSALRGLARKTLETLAKNMRVAAALPEGQVPAGS